MQRAPLPPVAGLKADGRAAKRSGDVHRRATERLLEQTAARLEKGDAAVRRQERREAG